MALILHDAQGLSSPELAEAMDIPLGTAKSHIRRGRMALAARRHRPGARRPPRDLPKLPALYASMIQTLADLKALAGARKPASTTGAPTALPARWPIPSRRPTIARPR